LLNNEDRFIFVLKAYFRLIFFDFFLWLSKMAPLSFTYLISDFYSIELNAFDVLADREEFELNPLSFF
jgi:hypothetical protein